MRTAHEVENAIESLTELLEKEFTGTSDGVTLTFMISALCWVVGKNHLIDASAIIGEVASRRNRAVTA